MITNNERRLFDMLDRAFKLVCFWRERNQSQTAEVDSLKRRVSHFRNRTDYYRGRFMQACQTINAQRIEIAKSEIPYPKAASEEAEVIRLRGVVSRLQDRLTNREEAPETFEAYNAQNELELLRTIRRSQAEGITKLRQQLTEACTERDAASKRANSWREDYNRVEQERDVARKGLSQAREEIRDLNERVKFLQEMREKAIHKFNDYCKELEQARRANRGLDQDRQKLYQEMDILRNQLAVSQAVNHIVARREANNPRLEMMLEESYRNEFKRNIDNQKATDAPNCQSS